MGKLSKKQRKLLKTLASTAHERELRGHLEGLCGEFERWKKGEISSGELSHLIHLYHKGPSRELYERYKNVPVEILVAYAVAKRLIDEQDIAGELAPYVEKALQLYRTIQEDVEAESSRPTG